MLLKHGGVARATAQRSTFEHQVKKPAFKRAF